MLLPEQCYQFDFAIKAGCQQLCRVKELICFLIVFVFCLIKDQPISRSDLLQLIIYAN